MPHHRHCRIRSHAGYLAHNCPDLDGMRICCDCVEILDCQCVGRERMYKAAIVAAERRAGRKRYWWEKTFGIYPK